MKHSRIGIAWAAAAALTLFGRSADAQDEPAAPPLRTSVVAHLSVETDVFAYTVAGYSVHVGWRPAALTHLRVGVGVFGGNLPHWFSTFLDAHNQDWSVRQDSYALEGFWYFAERGSSLFAGVYVAWMQQHGTNGDGSTASYSQFLFWPAVGYRWYPAERGVFVTAWAGLGIMSPAIRAEHTGPSDMHKGVLYPFGSIHLGYEL